MNKNIPWNIKSHAFPCLHVHMCITWISLCGFQSESYMTTVSAVARLIPNPPARVESKKQNCCAPGAIRRVTVSKLDCLSVAQHTQTSLLAFLPLKRSMASWRNPPVMPPSIRSYLYPSNSRKSSSRSNIFVIWKINNAGWDTNKWQCDANIAMVASSF